MKIRPLVHYAECGADADPDGETMCVCQAIEDAPPEPEGNDEECVPEMIDGQIHGCGACLTCRDNITEEDDE